MSEHHDLSALAELCGILPHFYDLHGHERPTSMETQRALLAANGVDVSDDAAIHHSLNRIRHDLHDRWFPDEIIINSGEAAPQNFGLGATWELRLEGDTAIYAQGAPGDHITLPPLPSGIYELTASASGRTEITTVIVAPKHLPLVQELTGLDRIWGLNMALYGARSDRNTGLGDFQDLADVSQVLAGQGAAFVGINPLHNMGFADLSAISPYSPSHRGFLNTSYIALDAIPGLSHAPDLDPFDAIRQADNVEYQAHKHAHNQALDAQYALFVTDASAAARTEFEQFKSDAGHELQDFARFETLSEIHGSDWRLWPRDGLDAAPARSDFHLWLQWVASVQLTQAQSSATDAGMGLGLYLDLAVGPRRDGAEAWCEQSCIAQGVSIGAPPDHLNPEGQNWDLAAFAPRKLKAQRYAPFRRMLARTMQFAGVLRIDHVLGLNRSYWIPDDGSPGGYIRQPFEALLAVIKIEAERHNCIVIGEDLGLVPDGFRDTMWRHGFYGYSVLQYEKDATGAFRDPADCPAQVLSCFATHDTPTLAGYAQGRDIDWWQNLSWINDQQAADMRSQRAAEIAKFPLGSEFKTEIHNLLAHSNASLIAVQLDDVLGAVETQNLPGTIDQHPNWRRKYDISISDLTDDPRLTQTAQIMRDADRTTFKKGLSNED